MANSIAWVGASFDPSNVSGLVLRLESSSLTGHTNGDPIHNWPDIGPNGWNFTDSGTNNPTITNNIFGTLPGVTFDNVVIDETLVGPAASEAMAQNVPGFTIFTVANWNGAFGAGFYQIPFMATVNGSQATGRALVAVNPPNWESRARRLDADAGVSSLITATANVGVVVAGQTDYVGGTTTVWLQGVAGTPASLASFGGNSSNTTSGSVTVGADGTNGLPPGGEGFPGNIGAVLCYNRSLTSTEIGNITTWLRNKYSV